MDQLPARQPTIHSLASLAVNRKSGASLSEPLTLLLGHERDLASIQQLLSLPGPCRRRRGALFGGLAGREYEIALSVALGKTNREVAEPSRSPRERSRLKLVAMRRPFTQACYIDVRYSRRPRSHGWHSRSN